MDFILIGALFFILNFGLGGIMALRNNSLLFAYLKKINHKKWKSFRLLPDFETGANPRKGMAYIFNQEDTKNGNILLLKKKIRFWVIYAFIAAMMVLLYPALYVLIIENASFL